MVLTYVCNIVKSKQSPVVTTKNQRTQFAILRIDYTSFVPKVTDNGDASATDTLNVAVHPVVIPVPTNLVVIRDKCRQYYFDNISWDAVSGALGYGIYTSDSPAGP